MPPNFEADACAFLAAPPSLPLPPLNQVEAVAPSPPLPLPLKRAEAAKPPPLPQQRPPQLLSP